MATVDVIIPLYNKARTIERTIRSIQEQTFTDWKLIVVDDGSTDDSPQRVQQFEDERINLIRQENAGPGNARNRGIAEATADYVAFLDADDQWYPWYLENALNAMKDSNVSFVGTMYEDWLDDANVTEDWARKGIVPSIRQVDSTMPLRQAMYTIAFFHVGNTVIRTSIAREYGGFYEEDKCLLGEDTVFFAKLVLNERFSIIAPVAVKHNRQDSELSNLSKRPMDIFLRKPSIVLDYCLPGKKDYAFQAIVWYAWNTAHHCARAGNKTDALYLIEHFPEMKKMRFRYLRLCFEVFFSRWFPCWIRFKCLFSEPIKKYFR